VDAARHVEVMLDHWHDAFSRPTQVLVIATLGVALVHAQRPFVCTDLLVDIDPVEFRPGGAQSVFD
jgi:hypothetical protein